MVDPTTDPVFKFLGFVWFLIKLAVFSALVIGIGISWYK